MRAAVLALLTLTCCVILAPLDVPVMRWVADHRPLYAHHAAADVALDHGVAGHKDSGPWVLSSDASLAAVRRVLRFPGHFAFTTAVALALLMWHAQHWHGAARLLCSGALAGLAVWLAKWVVGRTRPLKGIDSFAFHPCERGLIGLFDNKNLSFPSGDAALAFATAACLAILIPRWRVPSFAGAAVVAAQRVLVNAHHVTDVVAGAAVGILAAWIVEWALARVTISPADAATPLPALDKVAYR